MYSTGYTHKKRRQKIEENNKKVVTNAVSDFNDWANFKCKQ